MIYCIVIKKTSQIESMGVATLITENIAAPSREFSLDSIASLFVNICVHVLILLTFLVMFFFKYVSNLTTNEIDRNLQTIVQEQTTNFLDSLSTSGVGQSVKWDVVESAADALILESIRDNKQIIENNDNLYNEYICLPQSVLLIVHSSFYSLKWWNNWFM